MDVAQICLTSELMIGVTGLVHLALSVGRLLTLLAERNLPKVYFGDNEAQNKMEFVSFNNKNTELNGVLAASWKERLYINLFYREVEVILTVHLFIKTLFPQLNSIWVY